MKGLMNNGCRRVIFNNHLLHGSHCEEMGEFRMKTKRDFLVVCYAVAVAGLIVIFGVIIFRVLFIPLCIPSAQGTCPVDGGSVIGFTGAILGLAGAILAILGVFAVAYWWVGLDDKVNKQVEKRIDEEVGRRLQEQEKEFHSQITRVTQQAERQVSESEDRLRKQASQLEMQLQGVRKIAIISATLFDPWRVEEWAHEILAIDSSSEVAFRMVRSYLKVVDELLPDPVVVQTYIPGAMKDRDYISVYGPSTNPLFYWEKAEEWHRIVKGQPGQPYIEATKQELGRRKGKIEEYSKLKEQGKV